MSAPWRIRVGIVAISIVSQTTSPFALGDDIPGPRHYAEKSKCAEDLARSLHSLSLEPEPQLPAVIPTSARFTNHATEIPQVIETPAFERHLPDLLFALIHPSKVDSVLLFPNRANERLFPVFAKQIQGRLGIEVSGTPSEILEKLSKDPRINGFNPSDPEVRSKLADAYLDTWAQARDLVEGRVSSSVLRDPNATQLNEKRLGHLIPDEIDQEALKQLVSDNLAQYMKIWSAYFELADHAQANSVSRRFNEFCAKSYRKWSGALVFAGLGVGMAGGAALGHQFGEEMGAFCGVGISAFPAMFGSMRAAELLQNRVFTSPLSNAGKDALATAYHDLRQSASLRVRAIQAQGEVENAWKTWVESIHRAEARMNELAQALPGPYGRHPSLDKANHYAEETIRSATVLKAFHEAELPNGVKFSDLTRAQFELPNDLVAAAASQAERRRSQLEAIHDHLEETRSSIANDLRTAAEERARIRADVNSSSIQQVNSAIDYLKLQLEQTDQLIASAVQEIHLTDHLLELIRLRQQH